MGKNIKQEWILYRKRMFSLMSKSIPQVSHASSKIIHYDWDCYNKMQRMLWLLKRFRLNLNLTMIWKFKVFFLVKDKIVLPDIYTLRLDMQFHTWLTQFLGNNLIFYYLFSFYRGIIGGNLSSIRLLSWLLYHSKSGTRDNWLIPNYNLETYKLRDHLKYYVSRG